MVYKVFSGTSMILLMETVNDRLKKGWKLQGGVATLDIGNKYAYFQAMTKEAP